MTNSRADQKQGDFQAAIDQLRKEARIDSWNSFAEELKVPPEIFAALTTNRPELMNLVEIRPLTAEEHRIYRDLIRGLLETNVALRKHTQAVARLVDRWVGQFQGILSVAWQIGHFTNFRQVDENETQDDN